MSPIAESDVVRVVRGFKTAILAKEAAQMAELADRYLQIELSLEDTIAALSERVARLESEGKATYWALQRLDTYQRFQLRLLAALDEYNAWVAEGIREEQLAFAGLGFDHSAATLETARRGASVALTAGEGERILAMAGFASNGAPLSTLLDESGELVKRAVIGELLAAVAKMQNPRITARAIRRATGMALNRAMAIARTEQLRVYREATATSYRVAGVQLYQRLSARDSAVCIACLSLDGEISSTDASVDDHVNGHCTSVPWFGERQSEMEPAQQWFDRQSPDFQRGLMGPGRYDLYTSGRVGWSDLGHRVQDPVWGPSPQVVPLKDLAAAKTVAA